MTEWLQLLVGWVGVVRSTYPGLRMKNRMVSPEASWAKEWILSGLPILVVRSLAVDSKEVFHSGAAMTALLWWACVASPNCAMAQSCFMASVGLL